MARNSLTRKPRAGRPRDDWIVDEVAHLAGTDSAERIAQRLGMKPNSLWRHLRRRGRDDLWKKLTK